MAKYDDNDTTPYPDDGPRVTPGDDPHPEIIPAPSQVAADEPTSVADKINEAAETKEKQTRNYGEWAIEVRHAATTKEERDKDPCGEVIEEGDWKTIGFITNLPVPTIKSVDDGRKWIRANAEKGFEYRIIVIKEVITPKIEQVTQVTLDYS